MSEDRNIVESYGEEVARPMIAESYVKKYYIKKSALCALVEQMRKEERQPYFNEYDEGASDATGMWANRIEQILNASLHAQENND